MKKQLFLAVALLMSAACLEAVIKRSGGAPAPYVAPTGGGAVLKTVATGGAPEITTAAQLVAAYPNNLGDIAQAAADVAASLANGQKNSAAYNAAKQYIGG